MESLFREQRRQQLISDEVVRLKRDKAITEILRKGENEDELKEITFMEQIKSEQAKARKLTEELERRRAIEEDRKLTAQKLEDREKQKEESLREQKLRQLLHENSPEIRELKRQIQEARVSKERSIQKAHKQALEEMNKKEEKELDLKLLESFQKEEAKVKAEERERHVAKQKYHEALDDQRQSQITASIEVLEEAMKERQMVDEILKKLLKSDMEAERKRIEEQKNFIKQIEECRKAKEQLERIDWERQKVEEAKDTDYRLAQEYRTKEQQEKQLLQLQLREKQQQKILNVLESIQNRMDQSESLRVHLAIEEKELMEDTKEQLEISRKSQMKSDVKDMHTMQMWMKQQREELEAKEDQLLRMTMMDQLYKEDRLELLGKDKRRQKEREHRATIQKMIEDRRSKMIEEKQGEMIFNQRQKEMEEQRTLMVAEEKQRMLKACAGDLLGFLPKRLLTSKEQVNQLGDAFKKFYRAEDCEKY